MSVIDILRLKAESEITAENRKMELEECRIALEERKMQLQEKQFELDRLERVNCMKNLNQL